MNFLNAGSFLSEHPILGLIVFLAVGAGVIFVLSGGRLVEGLSGIFRVGLTIFTTPFVFLRDALALLRGSAEAEQDYQRTRVFMLFRYSRIQYLLLLLAAVLVLSGGITTALISLYPQQELQAGRALNDRVRELREQVREAEAAVRASAQPGHREQLEVQRDQAQSAYRDQQQSNAQFLQNAPVRGGLIASLQSARSVELIERYAGTIDATFADCPDGYTWRGYTQEMCDEVRSFTVELANRRTSELTAQQAYTDAERAFREADTAAQQAGARLEALQANLEATRAQRGQVSLFNPSVIGDRLMAALATLIGTALAVVALVWFGAIFIDALNFFILLMRAAEKENSAKLDHAGSDYKA